jgi:hypothetical protein
VSPARVARSLHAMQGGRDGVHTQAGRTAAMRFAARSSAGQPRCGTYIGLARQVFAYSGAFGTKRAFSCARAL